MLPYTHAATHIYIYMYININIYRGYTYIYIYIVLIAYKVILFLIQVLDHVINDECKYCKTDYNHQVRVDRLPI